MMGGYGCTTLCRGLSYLIMGILHLLLIASHCPGFLWTWARGSHCHFFVSWLSFLCHFTCLEAVTPLDWEDYSLPDHTNQSLRVLWDCPGGQVAPYFKWENVISIYKYKPTKKRCQSKKSPPFSFRPGIWAVCVTALRWNSSLASRSTGILRWEIPGPWVTRTTRYMNI